MVTQLGKKPTDRWHATDEMIEKWLKERQELLVLYHQLFTIHPNESFVFEAETLTHFCEILVDYVSCGHFRVFEKMAEAHKYHGAHISLDQNLLEKILQTTIHILDFNDKYTGQRQHYQDMEEDLSQLGEHLANRLDWEDELVNNYLRATHNARLCSPHAS